ncbi:acetyltransferase (GNAT) domain-containing protein 13 [Elsinoe australis]|uniref:Acetyltransferase (GNAT) domain-containing protein 13 n=1 Tax=Elsinoe australis TaxID=40998 RepID=A0A4U7ATD6_9PEZI|nr:acetyltransferase (GNAT) domain-containing protein 13 [Elsinoe australis]
MAPFTLSPLREEEVAELVVLEFKTFPNPVIQDTFMGPNTPSGHEMVRQRYLRTMKSDPHDYWIKVTDKATGKIIAASNWKICQSTIPDHETSEDTSYTWLQDKPERLAVAQRIMGDVIKARKENFREPYVHPDYARRGAGSMMLKWGTALADQLFLPAWVESSPNGSLLYRTHGFEHHQSKAEGQGTIMYRPARPSTIEGGKDLA